MLRSLLRQAGRPGCCQGASLRSTNYGNYDGAGAIGLGFGFNTGNVGARGGLVSVVTQLLPLGWRRIG